MIDINPHVRIKNKIKASLQTADGAIPEKIKKYPATE